ncbi:hypothetical protein A6R68_20721 [Neotoma lepida]|uniref:Uncharacterized protein n=1 Tax=Neotoma lepida TaxID=56216 RepID=A0A1A6HS48_NEOLE|nr:hypothetical protein A6R68_20721 [Neotoma lepida]
MSSWLHLPGSGPGEQVLTTGPGHQAEARKAGKLLRTNGKTIILTALRAPDTGHGLIPLEIMDGERAAPQPPTLLGASDGLKVSPAPREDLEKGNEH